MHDLNILCKENVDFVKAKTKEAAFSSYITKVNLKDCFLLSFAVIQVK